MNRLVTVREYARLTTDSVLCDLDNAQVSESAFDWLCKLSESFNKSGAVLLHVEGRRSLRWDSYVGLIETPCGTKLEILPKHIEAGDCRKTSRALLRKMIQAALRIKPREAGITALQLYDAPLTEWVMAQFLSELDYLIKRGVRFDFHRIEDEQRFLRGQLNTAAQMRQPLGRQQYFQLRHDAFLPDRAENRLLKLALEQVCRSTQDADNWRLANELRSLLREIPCSYQVRKDFRAWQTDRLMAHYVSIRPWCELVLNQQMPLALEGAWQGVSLLFPMEKLFENYVEAFFRKRLEHGATLRAPARSEHLCQHQNNPWFRLEPDFLIRFQGREWVLDAKWKCLDTRTSENKYGLNQSDFYQLFAYGHKYLNGEGELVLIYPRRQLFQETLQPFHFGSGLTLWVVPFDLETDELVGLQPEKLAALLANKFE